MPSRKPLSASPLFSSLLPTHGRIIDKSTTTIYIIMEHCGGGDLATLIKERRRTRCVSQELYFFLYYLLHLSRSAAPPNLLPHALNLLATPCSHTSHYLDESFVQRIFRQIASALLECHRRKGGVIMHRDLKPANIFLDSDRKSHCCAILQ